MPKIPFALTLASLAFAAAAQAADPLPADPVAASFARMLTEEKNLPTPSAPTSRSDDPLYAAFAAVRDNPHAIASADPVRAVRPN